MLVVYQVAMIGIKKPQFGKRCLCAGKCVIIFIILANLANLPPTLAYNASKIALNAITVFFAKELQDTQIKINSVSPGYVATDLNGHSGPLTTEQGAKVPVAFATLTDDGPNGGFFGENGLIAW
jgi:NAD(P)-dependent dehydrogenase (short-subunit alcohol dehydrogenase family)